MGQAAKALNDALALHQAGDLAKAEEGYRKIVRKEPRSHQALSLLGGICMATGRLDEAVTLLRKSVEIKPGFAPGYEDLGAALAASGKPDEAAHALGRALKIAPGGERAILLYASSCLQLDRYADLEEALKPLLSRAPDNMAALLLLGAAKKKTGAYREALSAYGRAVEFEPENGEALYNFGEVLLLLGDVAHAERVFRQVVRLAPRFAGGFTNLGNAQMLAGKLTESLRSYSTALELAPGDSTTLGNMASVLKEQGAYEKALEHAERAIQSNPENPDAHYYRAIVWLSLGEYEKGFKEYAWRWKRMVRRPLTSPLWGGESLDGKRILLHPEQGLGDTLHFARFAEVVKARGGHVVMECPPALLGLFSSLSGVDELVREGDGLPPFDVHAPLLDLPGIVGTTLRTIPARNPYLRASEEARHRWGDFFREGKDRTGCPRGNEGRRIGLCWRGNPQYPGDRERSVPLAEMAPLFDVPGVTFFSLQKGAGGDELSELGERFGIVDLSPRLTDFGETAAAMAHLDLVVSCDTAVAHLAGALGTRVFLALRHAAEWRWLVGREDTPWYPTLRLFRQDALGVWKSVFERMAEAMRQG